MRHRVQDKKFNRDSNARKALFMALLRNLTEHGEIVTTMPKAKILKRLADRMITQAKDNSLASHRLLHRTFGKRDVVNTLIERTAPAMADRTSGFTRITDLGNRRGDNTPMARIAFVTKAEKIGTLKSGIKYPEKVKKVSAKKPAIKATKVIKTAKTIKAKK